MDAREERVISRIEQALTGLPPVFSADLSSDDFEYFGVPQLKDHLTENGYELNATVRQGNTTTIVGSSREVYHA